MEKFFSAHAYECSNSIMTDVKCRGTFDSATLIKLDEQRRTGCSIRRYREMSIEDFHNSINIQKTNSITAVTSLNAVKSDRAISRRPGDTVSGSRIRTDPVRHIGVIDFRAGAFFVRRLFSLSSFIIIARKKKHRTLTCTLYILIGEIILFEGLRLQYRDVAKSFFQGVQSSRLTD